MEGFNLIKLDGKPLEKLIEVISNGIGTLYKPRSIKKEADAKAYEIQVMERAKALAEAENKQIEAETLDRIQNRIIHREFVKQNNIDTISEIAAEQLTKEQSVSEEKVDKDWTTRFFNIAEDVSDEEMQQLWGRVLAGEVKEPSSFSVRTLELLKNLNRKEAETFVKLANFVIYSYGSPFVFRGEENEVLDKYGISFNDRLTLIEAGLLQSSDDIIRRVLKNDFDNIVYYESANYIFKVLQKANEPQKQFEILRFTASGEQLLKLLTFTPNIEYLKEFYYRMQKLPIDIEYALILGKSNQQISHTAWAKF